MATISAVSTTMTATATTTAATVSTGSTVSDRDRTEDARMRWLLQAAPDATAIVDADGRIVTMNTQLEQLFRYNRSELIGRTVDCLVPQRFRDGHPVHRSDYIAAAAPRPMGLGRELYALRSDGSEFAAEISLSSLVTTDGMLVSVAVRDVS